MSGSSLGHVDFKTYVDFLMMYKQDSGMIICLLVAITLAVRLVPSPKSQLPN